MSHISINRNHHMNHEALIAHVEELANKLVAKYGGEYQWAGDELTYTYSGGVTANIHCSPEDVNVDITLGMFMKMFKANIAREIEDYLDNFMG